MKKSRKNEEKLRDRNTIDDEQFDFDPLGSYTGVPNDFGKPVQDADDL